MNFDIFPNTRTQALVCEVDYIKKNQVYEHIIIEDNISHFDI